MADLVIRGMEMPKDNNATSIIIFANGKVSLAHDKKYAEYAEAVLLPAGHGRLGDLDALACSDEVKRKGCAYQEEIFRFPTIVPAEGGGEK